MAATLLAAAAYAAYRLPDHLRARARRAAAAQSPGGRDRADLRDHRRAPPDDRLQLLAPSLGPTGRMGWRCAMAGSGPARCGISSPPRSASTTFHCAGLHDCLTRRADVRRSQGARATGARDQRQHRAGTHGGEVRDDHRRRRSQQAGHRRHAVRARGIITDLLGEPGSAIELGPGDLRRVQPAIVTAKKEPPA